MTNLREIEPYNEMGEPVLHTYLEYLGPNEDNASGRSNKFWEVAVLHDAKQGVYLVVRRWGRYGSKGQVKPEKSYSRSAAKRKARGYAKKKREKGYTREVDVITRLGLLTEPEAA